MPVRSAGECVAERAPPGVSVHSRRSWCPSLRTSPCSSRRSRISCRRRSPVGSSRRAEIARAEQTLTAFTCNPALTAPACHVRRAGRLRPEPARLRGGARAPPGWYVSNATFGQGWHTRSRHDRQVDPRGNVGQPSVASDMITFVDRNVTQNMAQTRRRSCSWH